MAKKDAEKRRVDFRCFSHIYVFRRRCSAILVTAAMPTRCLAERSPRAHYLICVPNGSAQHRGGARRHALQRLANGRRQ